jgi:predicted aspartyl protease
MTHRSICAILAAALVAAGVWVAVPPARTAPPADADPPLALSPVGDSAVLVDRVGGKSWLLHRRGDGEAAWLPIPRLDSDAEAARWRKAGRPDVPPATGGGAPGAADLLKRQGYVAVPLDRLTSGYVAVAARINDKKVYLVVDSGAPNTHLDRERTGRLELKWKEAGGKAPLPAGQRASGVCVLEGLEVGPCRVGRLVVGAHDLSHINQALEPYFDPPVDGVLGTDVLIRHGAVIDYPASVLFLRARHAPE